MKRWIAYENDDHGQPTASYVLAIAETSEEASRRMIQAIDARAATASREGRERLYAIFVEALRELPADDPRSNLITDPSNPVFSALYELAKTQGAARSDLPGAPRRRRGRDEPW